jgi:hypothetical protein
MDKGAAIRIDPSEIVFAASDTGPEEKTVIAEEVTILWVCLKKTGARFAWIRQTVWSHLCFGLWRQKQ